MESQTNKYVAGLIFSHDKSKVLLIRKNRPEWQSGFLNAIGGKIGKEESAISAMIRQCDAEAECWTEPKDWAHVLTLRFLHAEIEFYATIRPKDSVFFDPNLKLISPTDEQLEVIDLSSLQLRNDVVYNLRSLIPLALDRLLQVV